MKEPGIYRSCSAGRSCCCRMREQRFFRSCSVCCSCWWACCKTSYRMTVSVRGPGCCSHRRITWKLEMLIYRSCCYRRCCELGRLIYRKSCCSGDRMKEPESFRSCCCGRISGREPGSHRKTGVDHRSHGIDPIQQWSQPLPQPQAGQPGQRRP